MRWCHDTYWIFNNKKNHSLHLNSCFSAPELLNNRKVDLVIYEHLIDELKYMDIATSDTDKLNMNCLIAKEIVEVKDKINLDVWKDYLEK